MLRREFRDLVEIEELLGALRERVAEAHFDALETVRRENGSEWTPAQRELMVEMRDRFAELREMVWAKELDAAIANAILRTGGLQRVPEI